MMSGVLLLGAIFAIGLLIGWGFGGALRNLAHVRVMWWFLFPIALVLQVIPMSQGEAGVTRYFPFAILLLSYVALVVAVVANWWLRAFPVILVGLVLNVIPIAVNQGMPVSGSAVAEAGGRVADVPTARGAKHHLATSRDQVTFLADVIPIREPFGTVVSAGDIVMYGGAAWFLAAAMLAMPSRRLPKASRPARQPRPSTRSGSRR